MLNIAEYKHLNVIKHYKRKNMEELLGKGQMLGYKDKWEHLRDLKPIDTYLWKCLLPKIRSFQKNLFH